MSSLKNFTFLSLLDKLESLPSRDKIHNSLTKRETSDVDYRHLTSIWKTFRMKNTKDYHNMYLKLDVLL